MKLSILVRQEKARQRKADLADIVGPMREAKGKGKTKGTLQNIANALNKQNIPAPRGGQWHPTSVRRILA